MYKPLTKGNINLFFCSLHHFYYIFCWKKSRKPLVKKFPFCVLSFMVCLRFVFLSSHFLCNARTGKKKILVSYIWEHPFLGQSQASINPSIDNLCNSDFSGPNLDQICSTLCDAQTQKGQQLNRFYIRQIKQNVVLYESFLWLMIQVRILEYQGKLDLSGPIFLKCPSII